MFGGGGILGNSSVINSLNITRERCTASHEWKVLGTSSLFYCTSPPLRTDAKGKAHPRIFIDKKRQWSWNTGMSMSLRNSQEMQNNWIAIILLLYSTVAIFFAAPSTTLCMGIIWITRSLRNRTLCVFCRLGEEVSMRKDKNRSVFSTLGAPQSLLRLSSWRWWWP